MIAFVMSFLSQWILITVTTITIWGIHEALCHLKSCRHTQKFSEPLLQMKIDPN